MYKIYQVEMGDTIESLSRKFGITNEELININGLTGPIMEGQLIIVPNTNNIFETYTIKQGDNMYSIASRYNTNEDYLLKINGLDKNDYIYPNQQILVPKENVEIYITKENDTLKGVANNFRISIEELVNQNNEIYLKEEQLLFKIK